MNYSQNANVLSFGKATANFSHVKDEDWGYDTIQFSTTNYVQNRKVYTLGRNTANLESYIKRAQRDTAQVIYSFYLDTH